MLKTIAIENFKSHKDTVIDLHPHVNIIYGNPQSGKSNILRAIGLVKDNNPLGVKFLSNSIKGDGTVAITLTTSEGNNVKYRKAIRVSKKGERKVRTHEFQINDDEPYAGFGHNVPDLVSKTLNLSELNIQKQLDEPYLITSSGGEFSRTVNRITNLDEANEWTQSLSKAINAIEKETKTTKKGIESIDEELESLEGLDLIEKKMDNLELLYADIKIASYKVKRLSNIKDKIVKYNEEITKLSGILTDIEEKVNKLDKLRQEQTKALKLVKLLVSYQKVLQFLSISDRLDTIEKLYDKIKQSVSLLKTLNKLNTLRSEIGSAKIFLNKEKQRYIKTLRDIKECPTCLSEIDDTIIAKIEGEL